MGNYNPCVSAKSTTELVKGIEENWSNLKEAGSSELTEEQVDNFETIIAYGECLEDRGVDLSELSPMAYRAYLKCLEEC